MPIVDNAIYVDGRREASPGSLESTYRMLRRRMGMGWIALYRPDEPELRSVADEFVIHPLAVEDTIAAHQRPKLERYADVLFTVLRPARFDAARCRVDFGELHVFTGPDFVVTVLHAESPDMTRVQARLEGHPAWLARGPEVVLYAIVDQVVDEYGPIVDGLQNELDEIESSVFDGDQYVPRKTHELFREVVGFQRATRPLLVVLRSLREGFDKYEVGEELRCQLRNVEDHLVGVVEAVDSCRALLQNILAVNAAVVGQRQNEEARRLTEASIAQNEQTKRISSWAAILFAPTLVGTIYGMNFRDIPELGWRYGYPYAFALMALVCLVLYVVFKRKRWL